MCSDWLEEIMKISGADKEDDSQEENMPDRKYISALALAQDMTYNLIEEQECMQEETQEKMSEKCDFRA